MDRGPTTSESSWTDPDYVRRSRPSWRGRAIVYGLILLAVVITTIVFTVKRSHFDIMGTFARSRAPAAHSHAIGVAAEPEPANVVRTEPLEDDDGARARAHLMARMEEDDGGLAIPDTTIHGRSLQQIADLIADRRDAPLQPLNALRRNRDVLRGHFADTERLNWLLNSPEMKDILPFLPLHLPELPRDGLDINDEEPAGIVFSTQPHFASMK